MQPLIASEQAPPRIQKRSLHAAAANPCSLHFINLFVINEAITV